MKKENSKPVALIGVPKEEEKELKETVIHSELSFHNV